MKKQQSQTYEPVDASPVKSFFVSMLTRDISLEEAILDLLDNCVDGILRSAPSEDDKKPYQDYRAELTFNGDSFTITDNCGGIPWKLHDYAFRMGRPKERPDESPGSVGVYGIGMKRAMFKMGRHCLVSTQNGKERYEVEIDPGWIADEEQWAIPVKEATKTKKKDGTTIVIGELYPEIASRFSEELESFKADLERMIAAHYAFIINKGFEVLVNGSVVRPRPTKLVFSKGGKGTHGIKPYIFKTTTPEGVSVFVAVGFARPMPTQEEIEGEKEETRYSSVEAGWTILCNDRAVLYCDRTELTGWGEAGVPRYHNQFIAISGVVEFRCDDARKLPMTTTKRGIESSSRLYLQIKNKMREGMRIFIDYTNKWKGSTEESKKHIEGEVAIPFNEVKIASKKLVFRSTKRTIPSGEQYRPNLPLPKKIESNQRRISFVRDEGKVKRVAQYLYDDVEADPSEVGARCFDLILKEADR